MSIELTPEEVLKYMDNEKIPVSKLGKEINALFKDLDIVGLSEYGKSAIRSQIDYKKRLIAIDLMTTRVGKIEKIELP